MSPSINVSDRAATEMKGLIEEQSEPDLAVRVFVQGACGCGAAHYGMGLENEIVEGESVIETKGVRLVVDADSATHLEGALIDYRDELMNRGFVIENPNRPTGGCGCGH
ncbi:MAG: iron-sulfur cluster assembly accessory protein [Chloroflexi bacterium]|nr:iron-sulfur cluster assembly accessory protein [Chloroflexota bacterium]